MEKEALKWHPDRAIRNKLTPERAKQKFQDINNDYEKYTDIINDTSSKKVNQKERKRKRVD